LPQPGI